MSNIKFRLAKPGDAKQIAYVHYHISDKYDQGFFAQCARGTDTVLKTKLFGRKVRHFNNSYMLITFTRSTQALFSCKLCDINDTVTGPSHRLTSM